MIPRDLERKVGFYSIAVLLVFAILIGRIGVLQLAEGGYYENLAEGNRVRLVKIRAPRGVIYDRNGKPLVANRPAYTVSLMVLNAKDLDPTIQKLAPILGMSVDEIKKKVSAQESRLYEPIKIKQDISPEVHTKIDEMKSELPGVIIEVEQVRDYLYHSLAFHAIGYVGEISESQLGQTRYKNYHVGDIIGKDGVEDVYDEILRGKNGGQQVEVDYRGNPERILGEIAPVPGNNLVLTIDADLQKVTEDALAKAMTDLQTGHGQDKAYPNAKAGAAVAIDVRTGEILAMTSYPNVDPNLFATGISSKDFAKLINDPLHPFTNRVTYGIYPPGSTFKMVTGVAALEKKVTTPDETILDTGTYWVIPKKCWVPEGHGIVNLKLAYAYSCNVYFYEMGRRVGIDALGTYARMFGLGQPTGIDLPGEATGTVASVEYKKWLYDQKVISSPEWQLSETLDAAIGQGFHAYTPLQLVNYIAALVNGGTRYRPHVVKEIDGSNGAVVKKVEPEVLSKVAVDPRNLEEIKKDLLAVSTMSGGTSYGLFGNFPVQVGSKTGTAENNLLDSHGLFIAFAPFDKPEIAIAVVIEQSGHGSSGGGPVAKSMLEQYFNLNKPQPKTTVDSGAATTVGSTGTVTSPP